MGSFGIIAEGPTDQIVIDHILSGYFNDPDIVVNELQPTRDETTGVSEIGGWTKVLEFCASTNFQESFNFNKNIIVHIDTDVSEEKGFNISKRLGNTELNPDDLIERVVAKLISTIGNEIYEKFKDRIIFAIAVHELECWLLPLYYQDSKKSKISGCLNTLNRILSTQEDFTIDVKKKDQKYYLNISKKFLKKGVVKKVSKENPSFKTFVERLNKL